MKDEIAIAVISVLAVLGIGFFAFNSHLTSLAIYNGSDISPASNETAYITEADAVQAVNDSEDIIEEMKLHNFSITYMNDLLTSAKTLLKGRDYSGVLNYTAQIAWRREKAFEIYDKLAITEMSLEKYIKKGIDMSESRSLSEVAKAAFYQDRYEEAENLLQEARTSIDSTVAEFSVLKGLSRNALNFIQRDWYYILAVLLFLSAAAYFICKATKTNLLKKKIRRMKAEKIAINSLMKKAQVERFKENRISGLTYNARVKKYREKLEEINEKLPIFEKKIAGKQEEFKS